MQNRVVNIPIVWLIPFVMNLHTSHNLEQVVSPTQPQADAGGCEPHTALLPPLADHLLLKRLNLFMISKAQQVFYVGVYTLKIPLPANLSSKNTPSISLSSRPLSCTLHFG